MPLLTALLSADSALGRADYSSFSEQTLMEMLISDMHMDDVDRSEFYDATGDFKDYTEWPGVMTSPSGKIVSIDWTEAPASGPLPLAYLPRSLEKLKLSSLWSNFSGTVDAAALPRGMVEISIEKNAFHGEIDFASLPRSIHLIDFSENRFHGGVDAAGLPRGMTYLNLAENAFSGEFNFQALPQTLQYLHIDDNEFSGVVLFENFPPSIAIVLMNGNRFEGKFSADALPASLQDLEIQDNNFEPIDMRLVEGKIRLFKC